MEDGNDWGTKREEANNRREEGRGGRRRKKTAEDDRKTGDLSINHNTVATRDSRGMQQRSRSDMRSARWWWGGGREVHKYLHIDTESRNLHIKSQTRKQD